MRSNYRNIEPVDDQELYKDKIITALFNSGHIYDKLKGICFRNYIDQGTNFLDDALQETFLQVCKAPAKFIIDLYEFNPDKLIGWIVTTAINSCVTTNSANPDYPKHSLKTKIFHTSNLNTYQYLSPTGEKLYEGDNLTYVLPYNEGNEPDYYAEMWEKIKTNLSDDEIKICEDIMYGSSKRGRKPNKYRKAKKETIKHIKEIVNNKNNNNESK